jgi:hypothetical protein
MTNEEDLGPLGLPRYGYDSALVPFGDDHRFCDNVNCRHNFSEGEMVQDHGDHYFCANHAKYSTLERMKIGTGAAPPRPGRVVEDHAEGLWYAVAEFEPDGTVPLEQVESALMELGYDVLDSPEGGSITASYGGDIYSSGDEFSEIARDILRALPMPRHGLRTRPRLTTATRRTDMYVADISHVTPEAPKPYPRW